jgi:PAS domain S-box-containing protein
MKTPRPEGLPLDPPILALDAVATNADGDLGLVFELAPVGLCISRDRVIQRCNTAFGVMFGYEPAELQGRSMEILYPSASEFESIGAQGLAVMKQTGTYSDERIMRHRNGQLFWCHAAGRSLLRDQPFACAVWMFEDISSRRIVSRDLTTREREIARQIAAGQSTKQIARTLGVSPRTIDGHRARLIRKVGAKSASEMIAKVIGLG